MTPEIWQDILTRIKNLRGDMIGQWQGDLDNADIELTVSHLGTAIRQWEQANPAKTAGPVFAAATPTT